jgi:hypothetical protein
VATITFVAIVCLGLGVAPVLAQGESPVLRTLDGDPDIQGLFTFRTLTPLERPIIDQGASADLAGRESLTDEEAAAYAVARRRELNRDQQNLEVHAPGVRYQSRAEGGVGGYNEFWYERGVTLTRDKRTSLVVDPPNGRVPIGLNIWRRRASAGRTSVTASPTRIPTAVCPTGASWDSTPVHRWSRAPTTTTCRSCRRPRMS